MALKQGRIGSNPDAIQYDDGDFTIAIEVNDPIQIADAVANNQALTLGQLVTALVNIVEAAAIIADNAVVRGDGGGRGVQDSGVLIDDNDCVDGVSELRLIPKASSTGAEGTIYYDSDDDHLYVATE